MKKKLHSTLPTPPMVVLVGVIHAGQKKETCETYMAELASLADTAGLQVMKAFVQRLDQLSTGTMIGSGKVEEIAAYIKAHEVHRVVFDDELTPSQVRNLEKRWGCTVWDRGLLILEIFAMHACTPQAKAQVELAQYEYLLPRLVGMWSHHSRQQGGASTMRGPGEKELETDKRAAQNRIRLLKGRLASMERTTKTQRKQRYKKINVTLVGYTNAGKSSLMQCLAKEEVLVADKLFATLSPTVRQVMIHGRSFLLADTVGFIHKLPHTLVACFRSTLAEVREADFLLHVVDFSHPAYEHHIRVVQQVLEEIEAANVPSMLVLNKQDLVLKQRCDAVIHEKMDPDVFLAAERQRVEMAYKLPTVCCSAVQKTGIEHLKKVLYRSIVDHLRMTRPRSSMDRTRVS